MDYDYRTRWAAVPRSEAYRSEGFSWMKCDDKTMFESFPIEFDEFSRLYETDLLFEWNERYGTMLDDFEEGVIETELETARDEVKDLIGTGGTLSALELAVKENTGVFFFF